MKYSVCSPRHHFIFLYRPPVLTYSRNAVSACCCSYTPTDTICVRQAQCYLWHISVSDVACLDLHTQSSYCACCFLLAGADLHWECLYRLCYGAKPAQSQTRWSPKNRGTATACNRFYWPVLHINQKAGEQFKSSAHCIICKHPLTLQKILIKINYISYTVCSFIFLH